MNEKILPDKIYLFYWIINSKCPPYIYMIINSKCPPHILCDHKFKMSATARQSST